MSHPRRNTLLGILTTGMEPRSFSSDQNSSCTEESAPGISIPCDCVRQAPRQLQVLCLGSPTYSDMSTGAPYVLIVNHKSASAMRASSCLPIICNPTTLCNNLFSDFSEPRPRRPDPHDPHDHHLFYSLLCQLQITARPGRNSFVL